MSSEQLPFERKMNPDGSANAKYIDLLEEDKPIAGQKFACISFVSPEKILKQKDMFFFQEFVKSWELNKSMEKFVQFLNFMSYKYKLTFEDVMGDFEEFAKEEKEKITSQSIEDDYKTYIDKNEEDLEKSFGVAHNFQTNTRGIKIRGVYPSIEEAKLRCKLLREADPHHDVYVGPVGMWMPWEPEAYKTGRVEYLEDELNKLMHEKFDNEKSAKIEFEKRVKQAKEKAMEDNKKAADKSGNVLTQTMNDSGELVNIRQVDYDSIPDENVVMESSKVNIGTTSANIKNEVFNSVNIDQKKKDD